MPVTLIKQLLMERLHHNAFNTLVQQKLKVHHVSLFHHGIYLYTKFVFLVAQFVVKEILMS